jgi:hypothetical protein
MEGRKSEEKAEIVSRGEENWRIGYRVLPVRIGSVDRGKLVHAFEG